MDIAEVAKQSGVPASTLRYYEEKGLIASVGRSGLRRVFRPDVLERLALIALGRAAGLSLDGKLYAAPFYGESSMVMYRKDLFEKAGLTMPDAPTWDFVADAARKITGDGVYGICLRG